MTMTKKEKAMVAELQIQLALRFTAPPPGPDVHPERDASKNGWVYHAYSENVEPATTRYLSHYRGAHDAIYPGTRGGWSQEGISMYSTASLAARALRNILERQYAERLYRLDLKIAALLAVENARGLLAEEKAHE